MDDGIITMVSAKENSNAISCVVVCCGSLGHREQLWEGPVLGVARYKIVGYGVVRCLGSWVWTVRWHNR